MARNIKLIWDFKGPAALPTAAHHEKHLQDYITIEKISLNITGHQQLTDMHSIAYMVVEEKNMITIRDILRPHRGELYTAKID